MVQAKHGDRVKVHYAGKLEDGIVFDSSINRGPLKLTICQGHVIPGFENALVGMSPGESKIAIIEADNAYCPHRKEMIQIINRNQFPKHLKPQVGQELQDYQQDGRIIKVMVTDVSESSVTLDANHALAGKDITFDIQLVEIL